MAERAPRDGATRADILDAVPARATAIYAHPDDPDVSCGGTLARWIAGGCEVEIVICAMGDKGTSDPLVDPVALAALRADEARDAGSILGISRLTLLGRADGEVQNDGRLREDLVRILRGGRPEAVVCPDPLAIFFGEHYYNHRDHREVGFAALDSAAACAMPLYHRGTGGAHRISTAYLSGTLEPSVWVDISTTVDLKADAIGCHRSQLGETVEWLRTAVLERAQEAGRRVGVPYAESFRRVVLG